MSTYPIWQELCADFSDDPSLFRAVLAALESPASYLADNEDRLADRGIDSASEVSPWLAFLDWLEANRLMTELDRRAGADDLEWSLSQLVSVRERPVDLSLLSDSGAHFLKLLPVAEEALNEHGLAIVFLGADWDGYPVAVASVDRVPRITELAAELGESITAAGDLPAERELERAAVTARPWWKLW
ncbi:hypothetical protein LWF01_08885 [Saxibacter everestensis]|uniref:DUF6630 domain-containing protein n=1 Tax=Saxibacter everestensis TaxID=2909229 RepID=A0ABY8R079_9MICO|nr:hypothetical protein LWF01_08885 [Brevibacteriaceae bacterium ZFBP1038]